MSSAIQKEDDRVGNFNALKKDQDLKIIRRANT